MKYFIKIHNLKSRIKEMQKSHDKNKIRTAVKDIIKNFVCLNCNLLIVLINILKLVNNLKSVADVADFFNHICKNINIIYQLPFWFLFLCYEKKN